MVTRLIASLATAGYPVRCTQTYRSIEEQDALYAQGRTAPGKVVTKAKGGQSPHNYRMAADLIFVKEGYNGPWDKVGSMARQIGLVWGGGWHVMIDRPHVERPNWRKYIA